jgi:hypothetical protein
LTFRGGLAWRIGGFAALPAELRGALFFFLLAKPTAAGRAQRNTRLSHTVYFPWYFITFITTSLDVGVLLFSATLSIGTNTLVSGK